MVTTSRTRRIAIFGISGVGKTTIIQNAISRATINPIIHLQASQLIKNAKAKGRHLPLEDAVAQIRQEAVNG